MDFINYILLFVTVLLSGLSILLFRKTNKTFLKLSLSFSGAYLFALTVLHLIPEVYHNSSNTIGIYILAGFLFQIILEFFSEGIEHGHIHVHKHHTHAFPAAMLISLCIHSFLEGMPLSNPFNDLRTEHSLLAGIILHHIPVALALMSMILQSGISRKSAVFYLVLFAVMAPLGAYTGQFLTSGNLIGDLQNYAQKIMAVVIGIFLHISTTILFETNEQHRFNYYKMATILLGAGLALLTL